MGKKKIHLFALWK